MSISCMFIAMFSQIRPLANSIYGIHNSTRIVYLTRLRRGLFMTIGLSKLHFYEFKHNFEDTIKPICPINDGIAILSQSTDTIFSLVSAYELKPTDILRLSLTCILPCLVLNLQTYTCNFCIITTEEGSSPKRIVNQALGYILYLTKFM